MMTKKSTRNGPTGTGVMTMHRQILHRFTNNVRMRLAFTPQESAE